MPDHNQTGQTQRVTLFVCSGCKGCDEAAIFLRGWANARERVTLGTVSILRQPEQVVRLGISDTPALVVDDELLVQNVSVDTLAELLRTRLDGPGAGP